MSTRLGTTTQLIDPVVLPIPAAWHERELPKWRLGVAFKTLPPMRKAMISTSVELRSRGGWALSVCTSVTRLAGLSGSGALGFLSGDSELQRISVHHDFDGFSEGVSRPAGLGQLLYVAEYAYVLRKPQLEQTVSDIHSVFDWSRRNVSVLAAENLMGYFAEASGIEEAIEKPVLFEASRLRSDGGVEWADNTDQIHHGEDGDGPWYFYSWLHSVAQVAKSALILEQELLHRVARMD